MTCPRTLCATAQGLSKTTRPTLEDILKYSIIRPELFSFDFKASLTHIKVMKSFLVKVIVHSVFVYS